MVDFSPQRKCFFVALTLAGGLLAAGDAHALALGPLALASHLGQPLEATIPLSSLSADARGSLAVHIASPAMFKRFHIERGAVVDQLRIQTEDSAGSGRAAIHVRTRRPVREPMLDFLIEADTDNGRTLREYTVLLDPAPGAAPHMASPEAVQPAAGAPPDQPAAKAAQGRASHAKSAAQPGRYGPVRAGDTLWSIADRLRPRAVSVQQMAVAIYRANPDAFSQRMNALRQGVVLRIPEASTAAAIDRRRARDRMHTAGDRGAPTHAKATADTPVTKASGKMPPVGSAKPAKATASAQTAPGGPAKPATPAPKAPRPGNAGSTTAATPALFSAPGTPEFGRLTMPRAQGPALPKKPAPAPAERTPSGQPTAHNADITNPANTATNTAAASSPPRPNAQAVKVPVEGSVPDVAAASESGYLTPRNLLLLVALGVLGALAAIWLRRRQYKPLALDTDEPVLATNVVAPAESSRASASTHDKAVFMSPAEELPAPAATVAAADADLQADHLARARENLDAELEQQPRHAALQDTPVEVDGAAGDAVRSNAQGQGFGARLQAGGTRGANAAAIATSDDAGFEPGSQHSAPVASGAATARPPAPGQNTNDVGAQWSLPDTLTFDTDIQGPARASDPVVVAAKGDPARAKTTSAALPEDEDVPAASSTDIEYDPGDAKPGLHLERNAAGLRDYDQWQPSGINAEGYAPSERDGEKPGIAYELDTSQQRDISPRSIQPQTDHAAIFDAHEPLPELIDPGDFDLDGGQSAQEPATDADTAGIRLDLARMYLDMEDPRMARDLLADVIDNGDDSQRNTARSLLEQI